MSVKLFGSWIVDSRLIPIETKFFSFPAGERQASFTPHPKFVIQQYEIKFDFRGSDDIVDLLLLVDAIRNENPQTPIHLKMKYVPFGRQDRVANIGESHSLRVFANLINSCGFETITVTDPHSDVTEALFPSGVLQSIKQQRALIQTVRLMTDVILVAPDGGSLKKIFACASELSRVTNQDVPVIRADKLRDTKTGGITGTYIANPVDCTGKRLLIVDDICDGGRTFIELAKVLRSTEGTKNAESFDLYVTHGIFSKGLDALHSYIDTVFCYNVMNDGLVDVFETGRVNINEWSKK